MLGPLIARMQLARHIANSGSQDNATFSCPLESAIALRPELRLFFRFAEHHFWPFGTHSGRAVSPYPPPPSRQIIHRFASFPFLAIFFFRFLVIGSCSDKGLSHMILTLPVSLKSLSSLISGPFFFSDILSSSSFDCSSPHSRGASLQSLPKNEMVFDTPPLVTSMPFPSSRIAAERSLFSQDLRSSSSLRAFFVRFRHGRPGRGVLPPPLFTGPLTQLGSTEVNPVKNLLHLPFRPFCLFFSVRVCKAHDLFSPS